jgi:hypothetical protein
MSPTTIALAGLIALLVLLPTRRLYLAGLGRDGLLIYYVTVWLLGVAVAAFSSPARFLVPILIVAYLAPFVTLRDGLARLLGRPPRGRGKAGAGRTPRDQPPMKNVTPPEQREP